MSLHVKQQVLATITVVCGILSFISSITGRTPLASALIRNNDAQIIGETFGV